MEFIMLRTILFFVRIVILPSKPFESHHVILQQIFYFNEVWHIRHSVECFLKYVNVVAIQTSDMGVMLVSTYCRVLKFHMVMDFWKICDFV